MTAFEFCELVSVEDESAVEVLVVTENGVSLPVELEVVRALARLRDARPRVFDRVAALLERWSEEYQEPIEA